jgi:hypothetical protein
VPIVQRLLAFGIPPCGSASGLTRAYSAEGWQVARS